MRGYLYYNTIFDVRCHEISYSMSGGRVGGRPKPLSGRPDRRHQDFFPQDWHHSGILMMAYLSRFHVSCIMYHLLVFDSMIYFH